MKTTRILLLAGTVLPAVALAAPSFAQTATSGAPIVLAQGLNPEAGGGDSDRKSRRSEEGGSERGHRSKPDRGDSGDSGERPSKRKESQDDSMREMRQPKADSTDSRSERKKSDPEQRQTDKPSREKRDLLGPDRAAGDAGDKSDAREKKQRAKESGDANTSGDSKSQNIFDRKDRSAEPRDKSKDKKDAESSDRDSKGRKDRPEELRGDSKDKAESEKGRDAGDRKDRLQELRDKRDDRGADKERDRSDARDKERDRDQQGDRRDRLQELRDDRDRNRGDRPDARDNRDRPGDRDARDRRDDRDASPDRRRERFEERLRERRDDRDDRARDRRERRIDDLRSERRERREGDRLIITEPGGRTIIREGDRTVIRRDESERFRYGARDFREERRGGEIRRIAERPDGSQVITITDEDGRLIRRVRRYRGEEYVLIDNRPRGARTGVFVNLDLAPPRITIPREEYVVDADDASYEVIERTFMAPPVERLERSYSLDEIRQNAPLRERVRSVDLDTITFDTGSWEVRDDQIKKLENVGLAMEEAVKKNPRTVFMIEGHTDAVGSDDDNLSLSDRRAESVAEILTKYFDIPAENLTTQGYGEQYLKVKTEAAEERNRRVTVRNITPLLSSSAN